MIIPLPSIWSKNKLEDSVSDSRHVRLNDPVRRIDRTLDDRRHRLIAGLDVSRDFQRIDAALLVVNGHGKYTHVQHIEQISRAIPPSLRSILLQLSGNKSPNLNEVRQTTGDLALIQAEAFEQLKCQAGKYVDRILAISVTDPGLWSTDFDGRQNSFSLCDPIKLSQLTGVTVIDDFPAQDLATGGRGRCLDALPIWMLYADRAPKVAMQQRLVLQFSEDCAGYLLPASDGLDSDLPNIRSLGQLPGVEFLDQLIAHLVDENLPASEKRAVSIDQLYARGRTSKTWIDRWNQCHKNRSASATNAQFTIDLLKETVNHFQAGDHDLADLIRSAVVWVVEVVVKRFQALALAADRPTDRILITADSLLAHCLMNQIIQTLGFDESKVVSAFSTLQGTPTKGAMHTCQAATAGMLGLFHIDQMQGNVPSITGAEEQRTLGRLTPGKPANWRQLLREMADFQPPAMKLRDAV